MKEFEKLYKEYYPTVYGYLLKLIQNEYLAEELTQDTFFKVLKNIEKYRGDCKLSVWICQIAKNNYYSYLKKNNRLSEFPEYDSIEDESGKSVEKLLVEKETAIRIHEVLHEIKNPYKEVFWMRVFGELSFGEIAKVHGKTESWARVTFHRAKMKRQEEL